MIIVYIIAIICLICAAVNLWQAVYSWFDHSYWKDLSRLKPDAHITSINPERVKYTKNNAKFKTTVSFSDGFTFVTHRTNRTQHILSYDISVDRNEIASLAIGAHKKALEKKYKKYGKPAEDDPSRH